MRNVVRTLSVLVAALATTLATVAPAGAAAGFGDVPEDEFYAEAVQWMVDNGITAGTSPGCFSPSDATSRGQLATFIHRSEGEPTAGPYSAPVTLR